MNGMNAKRRRKKKQITKGRKKKTKNKGSERKTESVGFSFSLSLFSASSKLLDDYNAHFCTFEHRHQTNKKRKTPGDKEREKKKWQQSMLIRQ